MSQWKTSQDDIGFVPQASGSFPQFIAQFIQVMAAQVLHLDLFQITPNAFVGVQIRRVARQAFQVDTLGCTLTQKILDRLTVMGRPELYPIEWREKLS